MSLMKHTVLAVAISMASLLAAMPSVEAASALDIMASTRDQAPDLSSLPHERVQLVRPPFVHPHDQVAKGGPKVMQFTLPIVEKDLVLDAKGTTVHGMTFGGSVPGPMMVVHEGDYVELTLVNLASNAMSHNIDFHAATGAMGGGDFTRVAPGQQVTLRWKATRPGTFVYHCAPGGSMTPWHLVQGMQGAVMVLPRDGLKDEKGQALRYDRAYYIGESEFYVPKDGQGGYKRYDTPGASMPDTLQAMRGLVPTHVVFNGAAGSLTGEHALRAKVGEQVLFIHSQANRDSRPHLIGGHGDYVWEEGKFNNPPLRDLETWFIRGGSAGAALYRFRQPGTYVYLNHNLIEAIELGAAAQVVVDGDRWDHDLMTQVGPATPIKTDTDLSLPAEQPAAK